MTDRAAGASPLSLGCSGRQAAAITSQWCFHRRAAAAAATANMFISWMSFELKRMRRSFDEEMLRRYCSKQRLRQRQGL